MANTYTQIHIQAVFAVKNRASLIGNSWKEDLYKYISGIVSGNNHKPIAINGMPDHIHIFFGLRPSQSLSDLMQDIKGNSSKWINNKGFVNGAFSWQEGYGAFSYRKSDVNQIVQYIANQEAHHRYKPFTEEYIDLLREFDVDYHDRYIFKTIE